MFGECHAHMVLDSIDFHQAIARHEHGVQDDIVRRNLKAYQDRGITFVRDGGDRYGVCKRAKQLAPEYGIDYRIPTFTIIQKDHYGSFLGRPYTDMNDFRVLVDQARQEGADFIKLMVSGICDFNEFGVIMFGHSPLDYIKEQIHIVHEEGFAAMVHVNGPEAIKAAIAGGADTIEHGSFMDDEGVDMLAESDTIWVPTVSTYGNLIGTGDHPDEALKPLLEYNGKKIRAAYEKGAAIAIGSDAGAPHVPHGEGAVTEYHWLHRIIGDRPELDDRLAQAEATVRRKFQRH